MQEFPPVSKLDPKVYGDQASSIRAIHIENSLDGFTINEVLITTYLFHEVKPVLNYIIFNLYVNNQESLCCRQFKK